MIFRYPGGKSRRSVTEWILSHAPPYIGEYREPMVGGGGVFFKMDPEIPAWIADVNPGLIAVYRALKKRPQEFIAACRAIPTDRLAETFERFKSDTEMDPALRYFFINRVVFGGRVNYDIPSRLYFSNASGWNIVQTNALERAAEWLKNVHISCMDYKALMLAPGEDVWIYVDPPYVKNTLLHPTSQLYQHSFTDDDHLELWRMFRECKHRVALSYDDTEFVRHVYRDYRIVANEWKYAGTTQAEKTTGKEILILNYESAGNVRRTKRTSKTVAA